MEIFMFPWNQNKTFVVLGVCLLLVLGIKAENGFAQEGGRLEVSTVEGGSTLDFGNLRSLEADGSPVAEAASRQVRLAVRAAAGSAYRITQVVNSEPRNQEGTACPLEAIRYSVTVEKGFGTLRASSPTPLSVGEQEIFISGETGEEAELLVTYDFMVPPVQKAGRYNATITYRVSPL